MISRSDMHRLVTDIIEPAEPTFSGREFIN